MRLEIVNVAATADLHQHVSLPRLQSVDGFLYDHSVYHCAYFRDQRTYGKVSVFNSGKMISIGTKSFNQARLDLKYAARKLTEACLIGRVRISPKLQNIVAVTRFEREVDMAQLSRLRNIIYEPDQFPGAIYYAPELEGASILIFPNGKVVVAGLRSDYFLRTGEKVLSDLGEELSMTRGRMSYKDEGVRPPQAAPSRNH